MMDNSHNKYENLKILIAEDEESNFVYLERVLRKGFGDIQILHVENGVDAVAACKSNPDISIVLMDIKMPMMNGFEALKTLRVNNIQIPIVAVTAYAMSGDREAALEAGFDDYLSKPFEPEYIIKMVHKRLGI